MLLPIPNDIPNFGITTTETQRTAQLASLHCADSRRVQAEYSNAEGWTIAAKLGYATNTKGNPNEHPWLDVYALDGARVDATLTYEPGDTKRMSKGNRDWHAAEQLSAWNIAAHWWSTSPGTMDDLLQRIASEP